MIRFWTRIVPAALAGFIFGAVWLAVGGAKSPTEPAVLMNTGGGCGSNESQSLAIVGRTQSPLHAATVSGNHVLLPALGSSSNSTLVVVTAPNDQGLSIAQLRQDLPSLHGIAELHAQSARSEYSSCKYDLGDKPKAAALARAGMEALSDSGTLASPPANSATVYLLSDDPTDVDGFILTVLVEAPNQPLSAGHAYEVEIHTDGTIGGVGPADWYTARS